MNPTLSILAACTLKATVILALATTVAFLFRRSSAAHRYALWFSALAVILLLPFLSYMTPGWGIIPRAEVLELMASGSPETEQDPKFPTPRADTTVADITAAPRSVDAVIPTPTDSQMSRPSERDDTALLLSSREARSGLGEAVDGGFFALTWSVASAAFGWIWLAGALAAAAPILFGWIGIRRLAKEATPVGDGREVVFLNTAREAIGLRAEVRLLRGPRGAMPMTWGIGLWSPARILLPVEASEWKDERLRSVLLHELAHVRRRDCLTQLLARVACAGYWFHPWVWITASRLLVERERACDDVVLLHSKSPSHYARDLVEVASRASIEFPSARIGIAMARSCKLDGRLRAILDPRRNRTGLTRRLVVGLGLLTALVALPVASLQWAAEPLTQVNIEETAENEKPSPTASTISAPIPDETDAFTLGVIDGGTGQPLAGATVTADDAHGDRDFVTDAEGRCIVPIRENSSNYLWVRVWSDGFVPMRLLWRPTPDAPAIPSSYTLALDRATVIGGRIVDDVGEPVSGATVVLNIHAQTDRPHESVGIPFTEVMSGKDGRWEYSGAPAAFERIEIGVHHPNYASHDRWKNHPMRGAFPMREYHPIAALRDGSAEQVLERGIGLDLIVLDSNGEPARGASVGIGADRFASNLVPERQTDAGGRLRVAVHSDDEVVLTVKHTGHAPKLIRFPRNNLPGEVTFQLSPGHLLQGQVVDAQGRPVKGARVVVDTWQGTRTLQVRFQTDGDGRFEWNDAPEDVMLVDVLAFGYGDKRDVSVQVGKENRIVLTSPQIASGQVRDAQTGEPVPRFSVDFGMIATNPRTETRSVHSWNNEPKTFEEDHGRFKVAPKTSHWALRIIADGYRIAESDIFSLDDGDQDFTFELDREEWIDGRLVDAKGRPVSDAEVILAPGESYLPFENGLLAEHARGSTFQAMTDQAGHFSFPPQAGVFILFVLHESGYAELAGADFAESAEVMLQPWGRIEGELKAPGTAAGEKMTWSYRVSFGTGGAALFKGTTLTDTDDTFVFERVPPGDVILSRLLRGDEDLHHPNHLKIRLAPSETARIDLGGPGRTVTGRISLEDLEGTGWQVSSARVSPLPEGAIAPNAETMTAEERREFFSRWLSSPEARPYHEETQRLFLMNLNNNFALQPDGFFRILNLMPGDYSLSISFSAANPDPNRSAQKIGDVRHEFTVPDSDGATDDEALELPLLRVHLVE